MVQGFIKKIFIQLVKKFSPVKKPEFSSPYS